jgi:tetratricopeptide (TPR) repeat protein
VPQAAVAPPAAPRRFAFPAVVAGLLVAGSLAGLAVWLGPTRSGARGRDAGSLAIVEPHPDGAAMLGSAGDAPGAAPERPPDQLNGSDRDAGLAAEGDAGRAEAEVAPPAREPDGGGPPAQKRRREARTAKVDAAASPGRAEQAGEAGPSPEPSPFDRGMQAFRAGDIATAIRELERSRAEGPGSSRVHRMLGKCYYRAGRIEEGRAAYRRYLELQPDAPDRAYVEAIIGG